MIKFFRKIRQKLLTENKFSKYLIYAIGEIALIVIGILIALQLNNWNDKEKSNLQQIKILTEIKDALQQDLVDIKFNIEWHNKAMISCEKILNVFNANTPYNDSLTVYFGQMSNYSNFLPNTGSYETLKSHGINLISNDSLRIRLTKYYEHDIKYSFAFEELNESNHPYMVEMYYDNFDNWRPMESAKPRNFEELRKNSKFKSYLYATADFRKKEMSLFISLKEKCEELIDSIKKELNEE